MRKVINLFFYFFYRDVASTVTASDWKGGSAT